MSENKKYYWLKLKDDFFDNIKIKKLRKIAGGDTYTIVYLKMQLLSLRNNGNLIFEGNEDTFADELALELDEDADNVKITLSYLQNNGLLEQIDKESYMLLETAENIGKEGTSAERVRNFRERQKQLALQRIEQLENKIAEVVPSEETEKPKREYIRYNYEFFENTYNSICKDMPKLRLMTDERKEVIKRFLKNYTEQDFINICNIANSSDFLSGRTEREFIANFDWILKPRNIVKILEGNYKNKPKKNSMSALEELYNEAVNERKANEEEKLW